MALPPDSSDIFLREVDENLRRDRARDFAKRYGGWITAALVLFLAAAGGWIYWQQYQAQQSAKQTEQLSEIYRNIASGNSKAAPAQLDQLAKSRSDAIRATALFTRAALAIQENDVKLATAKYREIAGDSDFPAPYRNIALIRQTALEFDSLKPEEIIARLEPLAQPGNPWFGTAGEMTGMAMVKQGKRAEAGRLFAAIAADKQVPTPIRARAVQVAGSLGVDASSALPALSQ